MTPTTASDTINVLSIPQGPAPSRKPEAARTGLGAVGRLVRIELSAWARAHGEEHYCPLSTLAELVETNVGAVESICRDSSDIEVTSARDLRRTVAPEFPLVPRGGEGAGHFPGVRLLSADLAHKQEVARARRASAVTRLMGLVESVTGGEYDFAIEVSEDGNSYTIAFPQGDGLAAMLRGV
jgi:hypothetical protein